MTKRHIKHQKILVSTLILVVFCVLGVALFILTNGDWSKTIDLFPKDQEAIEIIKANETSLTPESEQLSESNKSTEPTKPTEPEEFPIYVTGEVQRPGLVQMKEGDYLADAIQRAGGFTDEAAIEAVNLAQKAIPELHLHIPKQIEWEENGSQPISPATNPAQATNAMVNINRATQTELETLPGVGPSTAQAIIRYREENGPFAKAEDLMNVPGIKEAKFAKVKSFITVG